MDIVSAENVDQAIALQQQAEAATAAADEAERALPGARLAATQDRAAADAAVALAAEQRAASDEADYNVGAVARSAYMGAHVPLLASLILARSPQEASDALTMDEKVQRVTAHTVLLAQEARVRSGEAAAAAADALARASASDQRVTSLEATVVEQRRIAQEAAAAFHAYISAPAPQTSIGLDGCPIAALTDTMRDGSEAIGIEQLCQQSVAEAVTPQAALAVKQAFAWLGAPYACKGVGRMEPFRFDCSSYTSRAYYVGAGVPVASDSSAPSTRNMMPWDGVALDPHYVQVLPEEVRPGDLLLWLSCTEAPCAYQHVTMALADGYMAHTNSCGDVAHVSVMPPLTPENNFVVARRVMLLGDEKIRPNPALASTVSSEPAEEPAEAQPGPRKAASHRSSIR